MVYGELTERGAKRMMKGVNKTGKVFADMGSGKGAVCIAVAKLFPQLKTVMGVELVRERHDEAKAAVARSFERKHNVKLVNGDLFDQDFRPVNIMYVSNLCFDQAMNGRLSAKVNREMLGGSVVFCSKQLEFSRPVKVVRIEDVEQSWSKASTVYRHTLL